MADYDSGLPVRTEADLDERIQSKIVDFTTPSQGTTVDTDGNLHTELHGNDPSGTDVVVKLAEDGSVIVGGVYNASDNTEPSTIGVVAQERNATADPTRQNQQVTAVRGTTASTVVAMDVALHDADGEVIDSSNPLDISIAGSTGSIDVNIFDSEGDAFSIANPLPVTVTSSTPGTAVVDFDTTVGVAKNASDTHTYTVPVGKVLRLTRIQSSGSGKIKSEVKVGASGSTDTIFVGFNSTANPNIWFNIDAEALLVTAGQVVEIIRTNRDKAAQDVYSTIVGELIDA